MFHILLSKNVEKYSPYRFYGTKILCRQEATKIKYKMKQSLYYRPDRTIVILFLPYITNTTGYAYCFKPSACEN